MKKLLPFLLAALVIACKKDAAVDPFHGVWVEKTMRQDTVEFNPIYASSHQTLYFRAQSNPTAYFYQVKTDSILLKGFGSSGSFNPYYFNFNGTKEFTIGNFFMRPGLPAIVRFEKIK